MTCQNLTSALQNKQHNWNGRQQVTQLYHGVANIHRAEWTFPKLLVRNNNKYSHLSPVQICPFSPVYLLEDKSNIEKFGHSAINFGAFTN